MPEIGLALSMAIATFLALDVSPSPTPHLGAQGLARKRAREGLVFRVIEPILRLLAAHIAKLPLTSKRVRMQEKLSAAGEFRGLTPDEFFSMSVISAIFGIVSGLFFLSNTDSWFAPLACVILGPFLPTLQLNSLTKERCKAVDRGLPSAIDLAALCMGAGLDFPGAIRQVVANMPNTSSPIRQELERITQQLSLGQTRKQALLAFAARIQSNAVKEFVATIVQAEEKGTSLADILAIQATSLRGRRSILAEEAAARAGVMLMLPMLFIAISIGLLLMGPLLIELSSGGMI